MPLIALLKRHGSLGLLGLSSASYFVAMIVARKTLEPDDLYFWNALVTLVAIGFSFCFFGAEQLFLRFSTVTGQHVSINRATLQLMGGSLVIFTALLAALSEGYFFRLGSLVIYPVLGACIGLFVFVYNFLRVKKSFSASQLAANGWKFTTLVGVLFAPLGHAPVFVMTGLCVACLGVSWLFLRNRQYLKVTDDPMPHQWKTLFLGFLFSLFVLMLFNNADRLILSRHGSEAQFSEYVYLVTLLLAPFSLLSNYFGFKETYYLKHTYDRSRFLRTTMRMGGMAAGLFVPWFWLIWTIQDLLEVHVQLAYALPCLIIVSCRCFYAPLSALIGLHARPGHIHFANLLTFLFVVVLGGLVAVSGVDAFRLLVLLAVFWLVRSAIFATFAVFVRLNYSQ